MEVILLEQIRKLGNLGDVVKVKAGFARNFLLPQGKALPASKSNKAEFEAQRKEREAAAADAKTQAEANAKQLEGMSVTLERAASETGQLYGSVKPRDVAIYLRENASVEVRKAQVMIGEPIRELGEHKVQVILHAEVEVELPVIVNRQSN